MFRNDKRMIRFLLSLLMILTLLPQFRLPAVAQSDSVIAEGTCGDDAQWTLDAQGILAVSGTGAMWDFDYAPWYEYRQNITKAVIQDGISSIGSSAFYECDSLISAVIPESVVTIGCDAFHCCSSLADVTFPEGLITIGEYAFAHSGLTTVILPESTVTLGWGVFSYCSSLTAATIPGSVTTVPGELFYNCSNLVSVTLSEGVTDIGYYVFENCSSLQSITIPESVTSIGGEAFSGCAALTTVTIPDGITEISAYLFNECRNLTAVVLPESVTVIQTGAFCGCRSLTSITIPEKVTEINYATFERCHMLTSVTIPEGVTKIGEKAFEACYNLNFAIPKNVTQIGSYAFYYSGLEEATIPEGVKVIQDNTFGYCTSLASVTIPESVTEIGNSAFDACFDLTSVTIPKSVTAIGKNAFDSCGKLTDIRFLGPVPTIGSDCFCDVTANAYHSCTEETWTEAAKTNYGGTITWVGHLLEDFKTVQEATCTLNATAVGGCPECDAEETVTFFRSALGHSFGEYVYNGDATCTKNGTKTRQCRVCGTEETVTAYYTAGHSYTNYISNGNATCDKDGTETAQCDRCSRKHTRVATGSALGHSFTSYVSNGDTTCTENGTKTAKCDRCEETDTMVEEAYGHCYENGACTACGAADPDYVAPVVQPTLKLKAPTLEFKDMITVNAFFTAENIEDVVEMGMITYSYKSDVVSVETAEHRIPGAAYIESSGRYLATSQGIHAKYLGDTVYLAVYAELKDGSYVYTILAPYSPVDYATNQIKNSTNVQLKQLCAAMLNYGAEAQLFFGHNVDALANASLTDEQKQLPEAYREDMVSAVPAASKEKQGEFANNQGFAKRTPSISFEGAFCINYFFTPNYAPVDGITMYYWNEADYNAVDVLTTENASGSFKMDGTGASQYNGSIDGIAAKALSESVYVAATYSDGTTTWTSGVLGYSIGSYCSSQASKGAAVSNLAMATAVYGYQAKQYFP